MNSNLLNKIVGWDLELAVLEQPEEPPLIANLAMAKAAGHTWLYSAQFNAPDSIYGVPVFNTGDVVNIVSHLWELHSDGHIIVGYNSLGFDWRVLDHYVSGLWKNRLRIMALDTIDLMLWLWYQIGYPLKLEALVTATMGENKLLKGEDAPRLWQEKDYHTVNEYVKHDARLTAELLHRIITRGKAQWVTKSGSYRTHPAHTILTPRRLLEAELPDTSWMGENAPDPRRPYAWMEAYSELHLS